MKQLIFWLLVFVGLAVDQIHRHGEFAGLGIGVFLVPIVFVLQLMLGRCLGLHRQLPTDQSSDGDDQPQTPQQTPKALATDRDTESRKSCPSRDRWSQS